MNDLIGLIREGASYVGEKISSAYPALYSKVYDYCMKAIDELNKED